MGENHEGGFPIQIRNKFPKENIILVSGTLNVEAASFRKTFLFLSCMLNFFKTLNKTEKFH